MLNLFPVQFLAPLAYTMLRVCVGFIFLRLGVKRVRNRATISVPFSHTPSFILLSIGIVEIGTGIFFLIGAYTQIAALVALALLAIQLLWPVRFGHSHAGSRMFLVLLFVTSLSLFITGAGAFGFDLPI